MPLPVHPPASFQDALLTLVGVAAYACAVAVEAVKRLGLAAYGACLGVGHIPPLFLLADGPDSGRATGLSGIDVSRRANPNGNRKSVSRLSRQGVRVRGDQFGQQVKRLFDVPDLLKESPGELVFVVVGNPRNRH